MLQSPLFGRTDDLHLTISGTPVGQRDLVRHHFRLKNQIVSDCKLRLDDKIYRDTLQFRKHLRNDAAHELSGLVKTMTLNRWWRWTTTNSSFGLALPDIHIIVAMLPDFLSVFSLGMIEYEGTFEWKSFWSLVNYSILTLRMRTINYQSFLRRERNIQYISEKYNISIKYF